MLPKRRRRKRFGIREETRVRSYAHKKWVRGHECAIKHKSEKTDGEKYVGFKRHDCIGPIQSAHVRCGTDGAGNIDPSDCFTIPLCVGGHRCQHDLGEPEFERRYGIDMRKIADALWARSPARAKIEREKAK